MRHHIWLAGAAAALALGMLATSAEAAPASGVAGFKAAADPTLAAQPAHGGWRRYRYDYGYFAPPYRYWYGPRHRHYRYYGYTPGVRYYYGLPGPYYYHHRRHWW
jgi:hypothetical protein